MARIKVKMNKLDTTLNKAFKEFIVDLVQGHFCIYHLVMTVGSFVCGVLALFLFKGYQRKEIIE